MVNQKSPWARKKDIPLSDLDRWNTTDKGYLPQRHIYHKDHPETHPEVIDDYAVCLRDVFWGHCHWAIRRWVGDGFSEYSMDEGYVVIAWIRMPPAPMPYSHYKDHVK